MRCHQEKSVPQDAFRVVGPRGGYELVNVPSSTTNDHMAEFDWDLLGLDEPLRDYDA